MIKVIINDQSLHAQYQNEKELLQDIEEFSKIHKYLSSLETDIDIKFYKNNDMLNYYFSKKKITINSIRNQILKTGLLSNLRHFNKIDNHKSVFFSESSSLRYENTSYSEAFNIEEIDDNLTVLVIFINLKKSYFKNTNINLYETENKISFTREKVYFCDSVEEIKKIIEKKVYLQISEIPPNEEQTFLTNTNRYIKTNTLNQGKSVYKELESKRYYCIDNLHYGSEAHIEVFDSSGKHLGVIYSLREDGEIDKTKKEKGRSIDIK